MSSNCWIAGVIDCWCRCIFYFARLLSSRSQVKLLAWFGWWMMRVVMCAAKLCFDAHVGLFGRYATSLRARIWRRWWFAFLCVWFSVWVLVLANNFNLWSLWMLSANRWVLTSESSRSVSIVVSILRHICHFSSQVHRWQWAQKSNRSTLIVHFSCLSSQWSCKISNNFN